MQIFSPEHLKTTILGSLLCSGMLGGYYAITTWLPTYLKTVRGLSVFNTSAYLIVLIVGSFGDLGQHPSQALEERDNVAGAEVSRGGIGTRRSAA